MIDPGPPQEGIFRPEFFRHGPGGIDVEPRDEAVLYRKGCVRFEKNEISGSIICRVISIDECARDKLIHIRTVIIEPRVDVAGRAALCRPVNSQAIDRDVRKSLLRELKEIRLPVEVLRTAQAADKKVTQIS